MDPYQKQPLHYFTLWELTISQIVIMIVGPFYTKYDRYYH